MPGKGSAAKRQRQNEKRRLRNRMIKSRLKTYSKKLEELVHSKSKEDAEIQLRELNGMLDSAVSKGVYHKNTAARKKSKFHRLLSTIDQEG